MYSRYIPPSKGKSDSAPTPAPTVIPTHVESAPSPAAVTRPGAYSRYIPPAKSAVEPKKHLHFDENYVVDALVSEQPPTKRTKLESEPKSESLKLTRPDTEPSKKDDKKRKKAKKEKEAKQLTDQEETTAEPGPLEAAVPLHSKVEPAGSAIAAEGRKEKKKKKKTQDSGDQDVASEDDETRRRHKSVFEKKQKSMKAPGTVTTHHNGGIDHEDILMRDAPEPVEAHGLEPLPQPAPIPEDTSVPDFETLPPWLADPIRVSRQATAPFTDFGLSPDLGITPEIATRLAQKGYKEAFAIQTAVVPQLLPHHCRTMQSDILVSAATGSGKTLAYAVPVIRDLSQGNRYVTRLRALVVLPTRELVRQAQKVCEECAGIFALDGKKRRAKVGTATGYQSIQEERRALLEREDRYDPEAYKEKMTRLNSKTWGHHDEDDEDDEELADIRRYEDQKETLPDYVIDYKSKVDILICTPGRLVEHIKLTPGFSLNHVRWLIADEADKLLGQGFQQWLDVVIPKLHDGEQLSRHHKQSRLVGVRKVILSATMTRDLDLLDGLKLRRPKLVVLEGSGAGVDYSLPELLQESALKADANLKPLFLLDLLQSPHLHSGTTRAHISDDTSSSGSDTSDSDSSESDSDSHADTRRTREKSSAGQSLLKSTLIFTKSNQSALRLSRLLGILSPQLGEIIGLLTSETAYSTRKQTLQAFSSGKIRIIVASDLVARGIDFDHLENVINYDIPSSVASYVHRVGRTARAGRSGHAWTLFTDAEARWFWKEVAGGKTIQRSGKVERTRVTEEKEAAFEVKKERYEAALQALGDEVMEKRRAR
ncbi:ATP-dependent RNA helicase dbp6 [Seiridium cupressi]